MLYLNSIATEGTVLIREAKYFANCFLIVSSLCASTTGFLVLAVGSFPSLSRTVQGPSNEDHHGVHLT